MFAFTSPVPFQSGGIDMPMAAFRALVVDDDPISRKTVAFALQQEAFQCDVAVDGADALAKCSAEQYELVVTDVLMPRTHGHALSVHLLNQPVPPVIIVHTSVEDPRLAKDFIVRGVDDIVYKPTNYATFAAKAKAMVMRRQRSAIESNPVATTDKSLQPTLLPNAVGVTRTRQQHLGLAQHSDLPPVSLDEFEHRLSSAAHMFPVSRVAVDVLELVRAESNDTKLLVQRISEDPVLTLEVLRLANSGSYNTSLRRIVDLHAAVACIGTKAIAEIAIAISALETVTAAAIPWLDKELTRQRCLAAGMSMNSLLMGQPSGQSASGLVIAAMLYPLGRVLLGSLYPERYAAMIEACTNSGAALHDLERLAFPEVHSAATSRVLSLWGLPPEISFPLQYAADPFSQLSRLPEPSRGRVELVKVAQLLGDTAICRWLPWDLIEVPDSALIDKIGKPSLGEIVKRVREELAAASREGPTAGVKDPASQAGRKVRHVRQSSDSFDILNALFTAMGLRSIPVEETISKTEPAIVNCIGVTAEQTKRWEQSPCRPECLLIIDRELPNAISGMATNVLLPTSFARLKHQCEKLSFGEE